MNYLAHAFLTHGQSELLMGNLMADFVKGNNLSAYPPHIQSGIRLHRAIDRFTDEHLLIQESKKLFKPHFYISSGVFTDILYDHFLANDEGHFSDQSLRIFADQIYTFIQSNQQFLTPSMRVFFGYMSSYNWLYGYRFEDGLSRSIMGICKRFPRLGNGEKALEIIQDQKDNFKTHYNQFFPELIEFSRNWILQHKL